MYISGNVFHQQECFKLYCIPERTKSEVQAFDHLPVSVKRCFPAEAVTNHAHLLNVLVSVLLAMNVKHSVSGASFPYKLNSWGRMRWGWCCRRSSSVCAFPVTWCKVPHLCLHSTLCSGFADLQFGNVMLPSAGHQCPSSSSRATCPFCAIPVTAVEFCLITCHLPACCDLVLLYFVKHDEIVPNHVSFRRVGGQS